MKIAIIGCGWIGEKLARFLSAKGHYVIVTTTSVEKTERLKEISAEVHLLDFSRNFETDFLNDVEITIFSMPISRDSWLEGFKKIKNSFPKTILFSSTGIYPPENRTFTENDKVNLRPDILAAENLVKEKFPQTNILRFGGLMGAERSLRNFYLHKKPADPKKKSNYIHYEDILNIVELFLNSDTQSEIYNIVAPEHPSVAEILNCKDSEHFFESSEREARIISSEKLIRDFNYTFIHPNPKNF